MKTVQYKNEVTGHLYREDQLDDKGRLHGYHRVYGYKGTLLYEGWFSEGELHGHSVAYENGKVVTFNTFNHGECTTPFVLDIINDFRLWWYGY